MRNARYRTLTLLMALLATMTLSLRARAQVRDLIPANPVSQSLPTGQAGLDSGALPIPAHKPLCHLRCRGFVASVPDAPQQPRTDITAPLESFVVYLAPASGTAVTHLNTISPPDSSLPRSIVLRL